MRVAYADPPYEGCAHYYDEREVDHPALIARLIVEFPDGWALSCKTNSVRALYPLCPEDTRLCAWVKGWASYKPGVHPAYAWEPVLVRGGRKPSRAQATVRDWLRAHPTTRKEFTGRKPEAFSLWIFGLLGLQSGDELVDLYPGSGAVGRTWERYSAQRSLAVSA